MRNIRLAVCFLCTMEIVLCPNFSPGWHVMKKHWGNRFSEIEDKNACRTPQAQKKSPTGMQVLSDIWKHWATFRLGYTWNSVSKYKLHEAMTASQSDDAEKTEPIQLIPEAVWASFLALGFITHYPLWQRVKGSNILLYTFPDRTLGDKHFCLSLLKASCLWRKLGTTFSVQQ